MSEPLVLVDSSVWIRHLTRHAADASRHIDELLNAHRVATNAVIRLELLTGARDEAQYADLEDALHGLHDLPLSDAVWRRAERLRFTLRSRGRVIPVPDVLIACCALVHDCAILHADRHFDAIARATPLKIYHP